MSEVGQICYMLSVTTDKMATKQRENNLHLV